MKVTRKLLLDWLNIARWLLRRGQVAEARDALVRYHSLYAGVPASTKRSWRGRQS
jgi:hypothetical protein